MALDTYKYRPITFQGVELPATLMAISILEPVLNMTDKDLADWLWRLPICCGFTKSSSATRCVRSAEKAVDLLLEQRMRVLDGIRERLAADGFDPEAVYQDWITSLHKIIDLGKASGGEDCFWSAPSHPRDPIKTSADVARLFNAIEDKMRLYDGEE
jgi:hypothetical protein